MGTQYSTRAANAFACVANYSPDSAFDYSATLFENQPEEATEGLTNKQLIDLAKKVKVAKESSVAKLHQRHEVQELGDGIHRAGTRRTDSEL